MNRNDFLRLLSSGGFCDYPYEGGMKKEERRQNTKTKSKTVKKIIKKVLTILKAYTIIDERQTQQMWRYSSVG